MALHRLPVPTHKLFEKNQIKKMGFRYLCNLCDLCKVDTSALKNEPMNAHRAKVLVL